MKASQESFEDAKDIVNKAYIFDSNQKILEFDSFTPHWGSYINGIQTPNIEAVVWEDVEENNWKVRVPSKKLGTFELNGRALKQDDSMEFVHSSGYFAIAKDEETMKVFLHKQIK